MTATATHLEIDAPAAQAAPAASVAKVSSAAPMPLPPRTPTIWGCTPSQVHDRFWAALGVQVVRPGERSEIVAGAELYLLCRPETLVLFRPAALLDSLYWLHPRLLLLRVRDLRLRDYHEVTVTQGDRLVRFERVYRDARSRSTRVALTPDARIAALWQNAPGATSPWRLLRSVVERKHRVVRPVSGRAYDRRDDAQVMDCLRDVMRCWGRPDRTILRATRAQRHVWADPTAVVGRRAAFTGAVWLGAGRRIDPGAHVAGPAVLWDDPESRPALEDVRWRDLDPSSLKGREVRSVRPRTVPGKRAFDVAFILLVLLVTLPLYPLVALAILIEDGRPVFFGHRRETVGGREFACLKFRSMRKTADAMKEQLAGRNEADGPQFVIHDDPRVTRVGRIIRKLQIDELPQCFNVLLGHMSVVGPRPSPYRENQYCPAWREARLSVRPGITGLWQVSRTRRRGLDFQEWIRFDIEYVENASWAMDAKILCRTVRVVLGGVG